MTEETDGDRVRAAATAAAVEGDDFAGSEILGLTTAVAAGLIVALSSPPFWALIAAARLRTELTLVAAVRVAIVDGCAGGGRAGAGFWRVDT